MFPPYSCDSKNNLKRVENYFLYFLVIRIELFITCYMLMKKEWSIVKTDRFVRCWI